MSEPEAGSDVGNLSCRAEARDGGFVLNGQKTWISAAHLADHILVVCRTDPSSRRPCAARAQRLRFARLAFLRFGFTLKVAVASGPRLPAWSNARTAKRWRPRFAR